MIVSFAGHSHVGGWDKMKGIVKEVLKTVLAENEAVTCYLGGYGDFDVLCAAACRELKQEFSGMEVVYVTPYMTLSEQTKMKEMQSRGLYDRFLYPPIENTPLKFAISKRNEWMMTNADLVIVYVNRTYGGAYRSLKVAQSRKKRIVNVADFLER